MLEVVKRHDIDGVKEALRKRVNLEVTDSQRRTPLLIATENNDVEIAWLLISAGADVNAQDAKHETPLLRAGSDGRLQLLRMMLKAKPDFKVLDRHGATPLIPAAEKGHVEVVRELVQTKIDLDHRNQLGWTALMEAVVLGDGSVRYQEVVRILLEAGADPNISDVDGITPLAHARRKKLHKLVEILEIAKAK
ncbi:MAG: hypothetical protein OM95_11355 [Bdellovibrio sp. ArHS]|nr:MAG: hypothetical protein OM95_11355 [Bdellovibrio sp. ArHS]